ncbi:MAG: hypothetical protein ACXW04_00025 [Methylobacter sp.]
MITYVLKEAIDFQSYMTGFPSPKPVGVITFDLNVEDITNLQNVSDGVENPVTHRAKDERERNVGLLSGLQFDSFVDVRSSAAGRNSSPADQLQAYAPGLDRLEPLTRGKLQGTSKQPCCWC